MVTTHAFIKWGSKWSEFHAFPWVKQCTRTSNYEEIQLTFALMHPEDFKSILSINVLIEN